jgi:hypothetical protein
MLSEYFPELDNGALLDLEAEDYGAILKDDPSNEMILSHKINVDIERGDLAASRRGLGSLRVTHPELSGQLGSYEGVARLASQQCNEALPGYEDAQPSRIPSRRGESVLASRP